MQTQSLKQSGPSTFKTQNTLHRSPRALPRLPEYSQQPQKRREFASVDLKCKACELLDYESRTLRMLEVQPEDAGLLATRDAIQKEIAQREGRNFSNLGAYLFLAGHKLEHQDMATEGYERLKRILFGIVYRNVWETHPSFPEVFLGALTDVLTEAMEKHADKNPSQIREMMLDNRLAYFYRAIKCECLDVWRTFFGKPAGETPNGPREVQIPAFACAREAGSGDLRYKAYEIIDNKNIHCSKTNQDSSWNPLLRPANSQNKNYVGTGNRNHGCPKPPLPTQFPGYLDYCRHHDRYKNSGAFQVRSPEIVHQRDDGKYHGRYCQSPQECSEGAFSRNHPQKSS